MKELSVKEAFSAVPPRSAGVLCVQAEDGGTDVIALKWFTWLNIRHNPMLSFALDSGAEPGKRLEHGDKLYLFFAEEKKTEDYAEPRRLPGPESPGEWPVRFPDGMRVAFSCTLENKYKYPFKKVRIFNCDLDAAHDITEA